MAISLRINGVLANGVFGALYVSNNSGIAVTSTDGLIVQNTTLATSGVTVQMSPRFVLQGTAWDTSASQTVAFFTEVLPATAATPTGTWKLGYSLNGAAATYPLTVTSLGLLTTLSDLQGASIVATTGGVTGTAASGFLFGSAGGRLYSPSGNGTANFVNAAITAGVGLDYATDAVLKVRTRAHSGYATVDALAYRVSGAAGVSFGPSVVTSITIVNGIVTACS